MELKELVDRYQTAMNTVYRSVNNILKEKIHSDITTDQFSTLQYIHNYEQCTSTDISYAFGVGKSAVTAQINRLYDKGLIERTRDEKDRRNVYLSVNEKGIVLVKYTEEALLSDIDTYLNHFDEDEITAFIVSLEKLANLMGIERDRE